MKAVSKEIFKIWGKTVICYLLASLTCAITYFFALYLTNFTEGLTYVTRQTFALIIC